VNRIEFKLYDCVECSLDGKKWLPLKGPTRKGQSTRLLTFATRAVKALRFSGTSNANPSIHLYGLKLG
jgi:hypothetical protein